MTANRKIVQLSLITIGAFLILSTYFFYPTIKESELKVETSKEKINVQEEIKILEEKEQILIDQIQEKKELKEILESHIHAGPLMVSQLTVMHIHIFLIMPLAWFITELLRII